MKKHLLLSTAILIMPIFIFSQNPTFFEVNGVFSNATAGFGQNTSAALKLTNNLWSPHGIKSELQFAIAGPTTIAAISSDYSVWGPTPGGDLVFSTSPASSGQLLERLPIKSNGIMQVIEKAQFIKGAEFIGKAEFTNNAEFIGNIGIGTVNPTAKVQISGNGNAWPMIINHEIDYDWQVSAEINLSSAGDPATPQNSLQLDRTIPFQITRDLNTSGGTELLFAVRGNGFVNAKSIFAEEIEVSINAMSITPDYVFEENYDLMTLKEIENYYKEKKHLPEIPSASEMMENGLNLKDMNMLLLKKVEELTIHLVELNKEIELLKEGK